MAVVQTGPVENTLNATGEIIPAYEQIITSPASVVSLPPVGSLIVEEMEHRMILRAMAFHNSRVAKVAWALGITRFALYRRLEKCGNIPA